MQVYYLQRFWFFNVYNNTAQQQTNRYTMVFDPPATVKGQIFLNILSPGVSLDQNAVGRDAETGEIVGSHTFAVSGNATEAARRRMESILRTEMEEMQQRRNRKLAVHRSPELNRMTSLHHRVDIASGKLVEYGTPPARIKVE